MKSPIPIPSLCLVTDRRLCGSDPRELEERVVRAVRGGVNLVQLRDKDLPGGQLLALAERLRKVTQSSALLFVNERVDVALACGADGVQLGEEGMPVEAARKLARDGLLIGRSVHSLGGALAAESQGADLLVAGAIFPTGSHPQSKPSGPHLLAEILQQVRLPLLGIGGIDETNVGEVMGAGASGAAVINAILSSKDPERTARGLKCAMETGWRDFDTRQLRTEPVEGVSLRYKSPPSWPGMS